MASHGDNSHDQEKSIRERAHQIWESEGRPEGRDAEHWERARAELQQTSDGSISQGESQATTKSASRKAASKPKPAPGKISSKDKQKPAAPSGDISPIDRDAAVLGKKPARGRKSAE